MLVAAGLAGAAQTDRSPAQADGSPAQADGSPVHADRSSGERVTSANASNASHIADAADAPGDQAPPAGGDGQRPRPTTRGAAAEEPGQDPAEWANLEQFMLTYSPNKWQMYQSLPSPLQLGLRKQIAQRYRTLQRLERSDQVRFAMETEAIAIEDQIYATLQELRLGNDVEAREARLRADVDRLVANRDEWRRERLRRVKMELESLKLTASIGPVDEEIERLNKMTPSDRKSRVEKRIEDFKRQMDKPPRQLIGGRSQPPGVPADTGKQR